MLQFTDNLPLSKGVIIVIEDDTDTHPVDTIPLTIPPRPPLPQQLEAAPYDVSIEGLTPEELREIDKQAAAVALGVKQSGLPAMVEMLMHELPQMIESAVEEALTHRDKARYVPPPRPFRKRFIRLKLFLQMALPTAIAAMYVGIIVTSMTLGWVSTSSFAAWFVLAVGLAAYSAVWTVLYARWRATFIVCDERGTGIERRAIPWICTQLKPELATSKIDIREPEQGYLAMSLGINWWRVELNVPGQIKPVGKPDLVLRFVPSGDELVDTISEFQNHFQSIE